MPHPQKTGGFYCNFLSYMLSYGGIQCGEGGGLMALELNTRQAPGLSQRMIQSVRILQMTTQELERYLDELAVENPAMDVERPACDSVDARHDEYLLREEARYRTLRQHDDDDYDPRDSWNFAQPDGETLREHLLSQLDAHAFSPLESAVIDALLDCLDESGYLTEDAQSVARRLHADIGTVERMIHLLQSLEPAGVCAASLGECLRLQLEAMGALDDAARRIVDECLDLVARTKCATIANRLGISAAAAGQYCALIRGLDPRPGARFFTRQETQYVTPDVTVARTEDGFRAILNRADLPMMSVNGYYDRLRRQTTDPETRDFLERKVQQVQWVRQCISQRQVTLRRISDEIIRRQTAFFERGPACLQSMKLSEIADALGIHESTVSRAVAQKYILCDWGVFPMQHLFQRKATARDRRSEATMEQDLTSDGIKRMLQEIIRSEDARKPFSDRVLGEKLAERGVSISRRTVAKYRDESGIPDASGRRQRE